jgi:pyruvate dehydrogenase E2 component (dihydrolipoyllysine-residue acetyltransferase)
MAEIVAMPKLGFDMAEGTLIRWVIREGQPVEKGAVLAEIETDKATVEVESSFSGIVFKHLVNEGTIVPVGKPIAVISAENEKVDPSLWESSTVVSVVPNVVEKEPSQETETSTVTKLAGEPKPPATFKEETSAFSSAAVGESREVKASPLAKKLAREQGLDLTNINGSGPEGRIVRRDIESALISKKPIQALGEMKVLSSKEIPEEEELVFHPGAIPADETIPLKGLRSAIASRMGEAKRTIPHFYLTYDYCVDELMNLRSQWNEIAGEQGKLSVNDFIVKATALTLRQFPNLNSSLTGETIIHYGHINIGVAVAVSHGLLTVVCRDADQKPLTQISSEIRELANRARSGKVRADDIEGSTFSISNLGMFDVENFAAIINPPEAAILAVSAARDQPIFQDGDFSVSRMMKITISADHRITDGAEAAQFMQLLGKYLAKPLGLLASI